MVNPGEKTILEKWPQMNYKNEKKYFNILNKWRMLCFSMGARPFPPKSIIKTHFCTVDAQQFCYGFVQNLIHRVNRAKTDNNDNILSKRFNVNILFIEMFYKINTTFAIAINLGLTEFLCVILLKCIIQI